MISRTETPNPSPAFSSICISGRSNAVTADPDSIFLSNCSRQPRGIPCSTFSCQTFVNGNSGGARLFIVTSVVSTPARSTGLPRPPRPSAAVPDQSPQYRVLRTAVGRNDEPIATTQSAAVRIGQRLIKVSEGKMAIAHGSSNGRLLALALLNNAAASKEAK